MCPRALARDQRDLRGSAARPAVGRRGLGRGRHRQHPAQAARARLAEVEAPVHEDAGEPHLEREFLAIAGDVRKHFDECVLHRLVGIVRVAKVAVRDANRAPLLVRDEIARTAPAPRSRSPASTSALMRAASAESRGRAAGAASGDAVALGLLRASRRSFSCGIRQSGPRVYHV